MKKVCITQSNYIPWKGYFKNIADVDVFVVYDDAQYTRRDWRNRNLIKSPDGLKWLTIPVEVKGKFHQKIIETQISNTNWPLDHLKTLKHFYSKALHYKEVKSLIEEWYLSVPATNLSEVNCHFIKRICSYYNINTEIVSSNTLTFEGDKTTKLVNICMQLNATDYFTGPSAKSYLDEVQFSTNGINVHYFNYEGYQTYNQLYPPFMHEVTILDMMFNIGDGGRDFFVAGT